MKLPVTGFILLFHLATSAQSPSLSILLKMPARQSVSGGDSAKTESIRYKIEMKICEPKKMTERGGWFTHDTSKIDFPSLKPDDINCGEYFDKGTPTLISGKEEEKFNQFEFSGQVFAWEKIFVFKISNISSRAWWPEMYVIMPVRYKSFITQINLTDIEFQSGKVIFLTDLKGTYDEKKLSFTQSLRNKEGVDVKNFPLKEILEQK